MKKALVVAALVTIALGAAHPVLAAADKDSILASRPPAAPAQQSAVEAALSQTDKPKVLDFYADWCPPCRMLKPVLEKARAKYKDKVEVVAVDITDPANRELVKAYGVTSIPMLVFLNNDNSVVTMSVGYAGAEPVYWGLKELIKDSKRVKAEQ